MKKRLSHVILSFAFVSMVMGFFILSAIDLHNERSVLEGRALAEEPQWTREGYLDKSYMKNFETYHSDQFPLRNKWIEASAGMDHHIWRKDIIKNVYIGEDGHLIEPVYYPNAESQLIEVANRINALTKKLEEQDIPVLFALAPHKAIAFEKKLPTYIPSQANPYSTHLLQQLEESVVAVDVREMLTEKNKEDYYFKTDHHWTMYGAYNGYEHIMKTVKEIFPEVGEVVPKDAYQWQENPLPFYGSTGRKVTKSNVKNPDTFAFARLKEEQKIDVCYWGECNKTLLDDRYLTNEETYTNRYGAFLSGDVPEVIITNKDAPNDKQLLIIKDSYANALIPFFVPHFKEIRILDLRHYKGKSVNTYIDEHSIDMVMLVHNINSLINTPALTTY